MTEAWRRLLKQRDRFEHRDIEDWFAPSLADGDPVLAEWRAYIRRRYSWVVDQRKRLYIDMDGVVVDFESGVKRVPEEIKREYDDRPDDIPGVFGLMDPVPGAIEAFRSLSEMFDTYILSTAPWGNPSAWSDKALWVQKHLGDVAYKRLIISHHKDLNRGDFLVDDRAKWGADRFEGEWIQFGSPRFPDWAAVVEYLKARAQ